MIKKGKLVLAVLMVWMMGGLLSSCGPTGVIEIPQTTESTEQTLTIMSNLVSTYDILEDLASSNVLAGKPDEIILPANVSLVFIDQDFTDGDGIEFDINFGELGTIEPFGQLCLDGVYRAGKLTVTLDKPYGEDGGRLTALASKDEPFYTGNGKEVVSFMGGIHINRTSSSIVTIKTENLSGHLGEDVYAFEGDISAEKVQDAGTGIKDDIILFSGDANVSLADETISLLVDDNPLKKEYTSNCLENIVSGGINLTSNSSLSEIHVDFDPLNNEACDRLVEITINGKSIQYNY